MVITLVGYRGTGKSTVARALSDELNWEARDADSEIVAREGRSIKEIFASDGEAHFRVLEREVIKDLLKSPRLILASGGGAILNRETRAEMRAAGPVVWLRASVDTLAARLDADPTSRANRPRLSDAASLRSEIEKVLAERHRFYDECATVSVDTDDKRVDEIVHAICEALALS